MGLSRKQKAESAKRRLEIQAEGLNRRNAVLVYIEKHEPCTTVDIIAALSIPRTCAFKWLRMMEEDGHVVHTTEMHVGGKGGRTSNLWSRGENRDPLKPFEMGSAAHRKDPPSGYVGGSQKIVKAQQLNLERDPFIAAFFGPAKASQVAA